MSRRESREYGLKFLFQMEFHDNDLEILKERFLEEANLKSNEIEYFNNIVYGVYNKRKELDDVYSAFLKNWNLNRIARIDQTILRIATFEIIHVPDVPFNVSVSEAVVLAKKYSTEESRAFINGVLKNLEQIKPNQTQEILITEENDKQS